MRRAVLAAIQGYKQFISPHKGFSCAYRLATGKHSCSSLGYRAIRRYGLSKGLAVLKHRLYLCRTTHLLVSQRGDCDPGCDVPCDGNCDLGDSVTVLLEFFNPGVTCCDCSFGNWPKRKKRKSAAPRNASTVSISRGCQP